MVTVAMTTCYDLMVEVLIVRRSREDALRVVMRGSAIHGIFVALILELSIWSGFFFNPYPGQSQDGYAFGLVVAIVIILIDWVTKAKFVTVADERGRRLVEEVKCEDLNFLLGAAALGLLALIFWQGLTGLVFLNSPLDVLAEFYQLVFMSDFYRDVAVSLKEILLGICISGVIGAAIATFMHRVASLNNPLQALVHALIIAPIALLPRILGFGVISLSNWSVACVCAFALCPLTRVILALRDHGLITRITLSFDDALPFAAAAIVYGEAMNATAGFGFSMVVAGATFQTARGLANFLALLIMISVISLILRFVAKISLGRKAVNDDLGHGD
jgi:ABC-type nitrate/sulfonate/bicarbonate transport system permease component